MFFSFFLPASIRSFHFFYRLVTLGCQRRFSPYLILHGKAATATYVGSVGGFRFRSSFFSAASGKDLSACG